MIKKQEPAEFGDLQAAPDTAVEWTAKRVKQIYDSAVGEEFTAISESINAALAAERSLTFDWVISMQCKLAAERKRYDDLQRSVMDLSHPNCKVLLKERNEAREQLATAVEALQMLRDYQNGCPLPSYEKGWNEAMRQAESALAKIKEGKSC